MNLIQSNKTPSLPVFVLLALSVAQGGCGRNYTGTYVGTESLSLSGMPTTAPLTLTLNHSGSNLTGTWQGAMGAGSITGPETNTAGFFNVTVTFPTNANMNVGMPGMVTNGMNTANCGPYTGSITLSSNGGKNTAVAALRSSGATTGAVPYTNGGLPYSNGMPYTNGVPYNPANPYSGVPGYAGAGTCNNSISATVNR